MTLSARARSGTSTRRSSSIEGCTPPALSSGVLPGWSLMALNADGTQCDLWIAYMAGQFEIAPMFERASW